MSEGTTPGKEEVDRVGNSGRGQCRSNCRAGAPVLRRRRSRHNIRRDLHHTLTN